MTALKDRLPTTLTTARLTLVEPIMAHAPDIAKLANNERVHRVMSRLPFPYTEDDARFFIEEVVPSPEEKCFAIKAGEKLIGIIGLRMEAEALPELGYWLGEPFWGQGFATEAGEAMVAAARAGGAQGLRSRALLVNTKSRKVLEKLGFREIGEGTDEKGTLEGQRVMFMRLEFEKR
ncbi:Protein N-acetyltransferase, RimJ/RimL family [Devosia crocina]|uniref:Protein N-acetyltransferase, RimJ/RimL family n=1 Tax=Devosia crocina TaxID=429728 RepID=A0A1I7NRU5_9HYPH|nr:GNAT family N-acetyltransferase [Devosia crocina]SFV37383.1 Protein N-acetyltransferase, RimJ/RimL family [Devosia crocina]